MRRVLAGLLLAAAACRRAEEAPGAAAAASRSEARVPRDVVLITIDTLRHDAVGFDGNPRGTTPHLDRFAKEGRVFETSHAHNVVTLPSHANILTGLLPYEHGVRENSGFRLSPNIETAATRLKARGYETGAFVGAFVLDSRFGLSRGFDVYLELYRHLIEQLDFNIQQARAPDVVAASLEWWRGKQGGGKPRFLWAHVYDPHAPYEPPVPYFDTFRDDLYLGEVAYTDASLAPLLDAIRAMQPPPLLIVTGDHGEARGDHGELTHGLFAYEATLKVPLMMWCPPLIPPSRDAVPARHIDILPTILDALGEPPAKGLTGQSLLSPNRKEAEAGNYFEALSAAFNRGWAPLRGILLGGDKYIELPVPELYDLETDPSERTNLVPEAPDALRRLRKRVMELPTAIAERGTIRAEEAARLRSLGYLAGSSDIKAEYGPAEDPKNLIGVDRKIHLYVDAYEKKEYDAALKLAAEIVAENPKMRLGYMHLATVHQARGDLPAAIRTYESAARHGAGGENVEAKKALLLSETGRPGEALKALEPYRETEDPETLNALGIALSDAGRAREALPVFARVLEVDPSNTDAYQNTGIALLRLDQPEEARKNLEQAIRLGKRHVRAWNALGVAWLRLGAPQKAIEAWQQTLEINPEQYDALYNVGRVAGQLGDWKTARLALERFVQNAPPKQYGKDLAEVRAALADMSRRGL